MTPENAATKMRARNPWLRLLAGIGELALVVVAALNINHTIVFFKLLAVLALFALWDIRDAVQRRRGVS